MILDWVGECNRINRITREQRMEGLMDTVDASCRDCGVAIRWLTGNPQLCRDYYRNLLSASAQVQVRSESQFDEKQQPNG